MKAFSEWRLIPLLDAPGSMQMAIDRWLLEQHRLGVHPPALRFYTWSPVAISLGCHQHRWPEFWQDLTWQGKPVDLVKRPTGGRAVLHQGDLSYALITSGYTGKRLEIYQTLCEFLIQGLRSLGVDLHYGDAGRNYIHNPSCFGTATGADLVLSNGVKLIGSAQVWRDQAVLQHGSIRLESDPTLFSQVFPNDVLQPLILPFNLDKNALIKTIIQALTTSHLQSFGSKLIVQPFSEKEWQEILNG